MTIPFPQIPLPGHETFILITAWHFTRTWDVAARLRSARALDRDVREQPGCVFAHRWLSRRSIMLESHWVSQAAADAWLQGTHFRRFDTHARRRPGVRARRLLSQRSR